MRRVLVTLVAVGLLALVAWSGQDRNSNSTAVQSASQKPSSRELLGAVFPRLSPDGETIAFSYQGAIWRIPRVGGTAIRLTDQAGFDIEPTWSPDGSMIAFVKSPSFGPGELRVIRAENGDSVPLPNKVDVTGTIVYQKLEFLSDSRILGVLKVDGQSLGLGWFDIKSGKSQSIIQPPNWGRYALSHDLKTVAYSATLDVPGQQGGNDGRQNEIWQVSVDGGVPKSVTRFPSRVYDLCWSHSDSGLLVVSDFGATHNDIWEIPFANPERGARKLTHGSADEDRPSVDKHGKWLVYTDNRKGSTLLVVRDQATESDRQVIVEKFEHRTPTGQIHLQIRDGKQGQSMTSRVSLQQMQGKFQAPEGALYRTLGDMGHFYCEGQSNFDLPAGRYLVRVYHGPEYRPYRGEVEIKPAELTSVNIDMERWANPTSEGWYSGENHIHANYGYGQWYNSPKTMLTQCSGEDLHVCNFMVANSDTDAVFDREFFRGRLDPLSTSDTLLYWNQEFRSTIWGHMTLVNLKQVVEPVFTGFKDTTNPWDTPTNSDIADRTHWQKGLVNYTHVAQNPADPYENPYTGKGIPIDVALGKIDTLDLNASYAGTLPLWYRLLNCGFRLPASAGTDTFLNRVSSRLPGGDRVYVKLNGPLNYENWIQGLRQGRSFVSNGPILQITIENAIQGDTVKLDTPRSVTIRASARSQFPMEKVELVYNGQVIASADLTDNRTSGQFEISTPIMRSGWISIRANGPPHPDHPVGTLTAHSSPVYVEIKGQPAASRDDAAYFLKWIDRLALAIRVRDRIPDSKLRKHVDDQLEEARAVYLKIIDLAQANAASN